MRPLIEQGYLYIAQPPLFRAKRGQSETYLKDQAALDEYLITAGLKDAVLTTGTGAQIGGTILRSLVVQSVQLSRHIDGLAPQISNKQVIEQAAIAGMLKPSLLDNSEAADYLAKRLDALVEDAERGWVGTVETGANGSEIVIARTLRGITERYVIDSRLVHTAEARALDEAASRLQEIYEKQGSLQLSSGQPLDISGPIALLALSLHKVEKVHKLRVIRG